MGMNRLLDTMQLDRRRSVYWSAASDTGLYMNKGTYLRAESKFLPKVIRGLRNEKN